jgi:hypothetical protein
VATFAGRFARERDCGNGIAEQNGVVETPAVRRRFMPSREEIFKKVRDSLIEVLELGEDEVTPQATLVDDLGAEPVGFLDIVLRRS